MVDAIDYIMIVVTFALILAMLYFTADNFFKRIYIPYKKQIIDLNFDSALFILKTIINSELEAYENDVFLSKGSITNSNFDNYYKDITRKIIKNISPALISHLSLYITEDMIYTIVARAVKKFLTEKITCTI